VADQTENGTRFRVLTLLDEPTRECLAMHVNWSIRSVNVITGMTAAMERYNVPEHLRSNNGPEFIADAIQDWLRGKNVKTIYITRSASWENAYIESFHDQLHGECLNREILAACGRRELSSDRGPLLERGATAKRVGLSDGQRVLQARHQPFGTPVGLRPPSVPNCRTKHQTNGRTLLIKCPPSGIRSVSKHDAASAQPSD